MSKNVSIETTHQKIYGISRFWCSIRTNIKKKKILLFLLSNISVKVYLAKTYVEITLDFAKILLMSVIFMRGFQREKKGTVWITVIENIFLLLPLLKSPILILELKRNFAEHFTLKKLKS